jgi:hypothetical protein
LKQKHKEGQRLFHYLKQMNIALVTRTFICVIIHETVDGKLNVCNLSFHWT